MRGRLSIYQTHERLNILNDKWKKIWMDLSYVLAQAASCPRGRVGAFIIDHRNNPVSAGYNGGPRGAIGSLCGGEFCERSARCIPSGTQTEIGCHHAEQNALMNALHKGVSVAGCTLVVTTPPCLGCARLIHHAGIERVVIGGRSYDSQGADYLERFMALRQGVSDT